MTTRTIFRCSDGFRCWAYELWYGMTHKQESATWRRRWSYTLHSARCSMGLHWPIKWSQGYSYGYEPPEPCFECAWCGFERLPYRAVFWEGPLAHVYGAWLWLRYRRDEKAA